MKIFTEITSQKIIQLLLLTATVGLLATGCTTYQQQNHAIQYWQHGDLTNAVIEATKKADENENNKDAIIWRLEEGAALRANGQYEDSNRAFDTAQNKIDQYAQEAKVKVGHEAGALLSNQANLPYEGRSYDGIMLNTYEALNYLALNEPDKARPEIIRAYQRQQEAVDENKRRIEKIQDEAASSTNSATIKKAQDDPGFQAQIQGTNYANLNNLKPYADYVNPFTVYLDGLFFMANAAGPSDLEHAHKSFERVQEFIGDSDYVKQDLAAVDGLMNGRPLTPTTYVIFETGCAPIRDQVRIDIPIIVSKVSYVGAAFPTLKFQGDYIPSLTVVVANPIAMTNDVVTVVTNLITATNDIVTTVTNTIAATNDIVTTVTNTVITTNEFVTSSTNTVIIPGNTNSTTELLADMDSVIGLDFKNEMPVIITKTIASTVTKAVAAYGVNQAAGQQSELAGLFSQIGTAIYQAAVNIADERTWTTLPKEFQFCRIPTPPDRKIDLITADGLQKTSVTIADGMVNIVYVKSINTVSPLSVTQMKLK
ncbi:MAG: COG3014 family protein [Limisphaerales bacterium]